MNNFFCIEHCPFRLYHIACHEEYFWRQLGPGRTEDKKVRKEGRKSEATNIQVLYKKRTCFVRRNSIGGQVSVWRGKQVSGLHILFTSTSFAGGFFFFRIGLDFFFSPHAGTAQTINPILSITFLFHEKRELD